MSQAAIIGNPYGLKRKAMNNAISPCFTSPNNTIDARPSANNTNAKIESSIELNIQTNWHTSKMIDTISVMGNNNILSNILI